MAKLTKEVKKKRKHKPRKYRLRHLRSRKGARRVFITRRKAMLRLQLSLRDFRRLCILKGIYPVEPRRNGRGITTSKTYYLLSDIRFLSHEPIIWKFWENKIFIRRLKKAIEKRNNTAARVIQDNRPFYKLDHIVKERYPTFIDALRDLDDALSLCFLFSRFPATRGLRKDLITYSHRLSTEFMSYVIESRCLRKVFVSIKGYYYQAEIMGQKITWIVPHQFVLGFYNEVDFRIMKTFCEFYITLIGFVNYRLFKSLGLYYPPKLSSTFSKEDLEMVSGDDVNDIRDECIAALNRPLVMENKNEVEEETKLDDFEEENEENELSFHQIRKLQNLFKFCKFYLNREVPRESLVFVIRSFGGQVSWDKTCFVGATYDEKDETITHQIVDREKIPFKYMNRYYVQPQWVYDSINARMLLPVEDYFQGIILPAHLSPFVEEKEGDYIPPEKEYMKSLQLGIRKPLDNKEDDETTDEEEEKEIMQPNKATVNEKQNMKVEEGKIEKIDKAKKEERLKAEEKRLRVMMIPKKKKRLYDMIMYGRRQQKRIADKLRAKRAKYNETNVKTSTKRKV